MIKISSIRLNPKIKILSIFFLAAALTLAIVWLQPSTGAAASLDDLRDQVSKLESEIAKNDDVLAQTRQERRTLENEVYALDLEISNTQHKIDVSKKKIQVLELEIKQAEAELARQEAILADALRELYKRGDVTTIELLASSDSYSEFINQQEYLSRMKTAIQESAKMVQDLKSELEDRKSEQEELAARLEGQRKILDRKRSERAGLLAETQGLESRFQARAERLQAQQEQLLAEIVARSRVITGVGTGSYPWADYRAGSWTHWESCNYGDDVDPWNYCYRQCTSYVAWRLYSEGKNPPINYGNATNWGYAAQGSYPTGSQPKVGAVAVWEGAEGHVAYVEEIYGDGTVRISEYNAVPALQGQYSQRVISPDDPSIYIYF